MTARDTTPSLTFEEEVWGQGYRYLAGIDEVGRGALAGPVVAAAVVLSGPLEGKWTQQVRDSKQLTPKARDYLAACIREQASCGVGMVGNEKIDAIGIAPATRRAMKEAVMNLMPMPDYLLVDYVKLPVLKLPQQSIVRGDSRCFSIACASIIAKVARDALMVEMETLYPGYGLARHKGYGTAQHCDCLRRQGPCAIHRRSFRPVGEALAGVS